MATLRFVMVTHKLLNWVLNLFVMEEKTRLQLLPIASDGIPRYDDRNGKILVPEDDFLLYKGAHDKTMILLNCWMDNREVAEEELRRIADELDKWEHGCNISSVVGGVAGIGGGAAVIGGVILMPPVAVAGLAVGGVAAASNMATGLFKLHNLKKNVLAAKEMLEYDRRMTETLANSIASLEETKASILSMQQILSRKET
ncbi:Tat pathway signal sequence domain protein [Teladorsagia circumcincta]|uniref:Tat pathway signal sequence domain protein n=3 Tax=Teladorsagia circumcincta TaxID=45464 RepID=A0A2G9TVC2_TELCI|nr:Tat pathway signal sequence domain protein [Teladorsagia circumcincta]